MERHAETKEIWGQMHQRLLSHIRGRVSTHHDAEDILQDVFVRIHANLDNVNDTQNLTAWVYRITRNAITDYYRHRAKNTDMVKTLAEEATDTADVPNNCVLQTGPECQPGKVLAGCLKPLVERLPEPYLDAVTLTELNGLTQKEAADELGVSLSGMKSRIQRGRGKLKDLLLDCCKIEVDRRGAVIDYERRNEGTCGGCNCE